MPTRPAIVLILVGWVVAATGLFRRDILPDFLITPPPDLRSIATAGETARPTRWNLSVTDSAGTRTVGQALTRSERNTDGGTKLISEVSFESNEMLKGTPFAANLATERGDGHLTVSNTCEIDSAGFLRQFRIVVRSPGDSSPLLTVDARVVGRAIKVAARGPNPLLQWNQSIPYEPRGLVQNGIGPIDRLPGLQVGQRWSTEVVSPLTGMAERAVTEVTGKQSIQWNNELVTTLEVVQKLTPISARMWVRRDGLVLRQEIPFPFVRLRLDRVPDPSVDGAKTGDQAP